jgi:hypothetical protein
MEATKATIRNLVVGEGMILITTNLLQVEAISLHTVRIIMKRRSINLLKEKHLDALSTILEIMEVDNSSSISHHTTMAAEEDSNNKEIINKVTITKTVLIIIVRVQASLTRSQFNLMKMRLINR